MFGTIFSKEINNNGSFKGIVFFVKDGEIVFTETGKTVYTGFAEAIKDKERRNETW